MAIVAGDNEKLSYYGKKKKIPGSQGKEQEELLRIGTAATTVSAWRGAREWAMCWA